MQPPHPPGILFGLTAPARALGLILRHPALLAWSVVPFLLTLAVYGIGIHYVSGYAMGWMLPFITSHGIGDGGFVAKAAMASAWAILLLVCALTFSTVAAILATPFNDFLAETAESRLDPPLRAEPAGLARRLRLVATDLLKALFSGAVAMLALVLSWIPALNILSLLLMAAIVCFQFISYPQTRRGEGVGAALSFILAFPGASLAFGGVFAALFAVPVLGCFALPLAVVGGTQLYARAWSSSPKGPSPRPPQA